MKKLYERMIEENTFKRVFYSGQVNNADEFVQYFKKPNNHAIVIIEEDAEPLVLCWVNGVEDGHAWFNFAAFRSAWGHTRSVQLLKKAADYWYALKDSEGEPLIKILCGMTPAKNKLALYVMKECGTTQTIEIPNYLTDVHTGKRTGIIISYLENKNG